MQEHLEISGDSVSGADDVHRDPTQHTSPFAQRSLDRQSGSRELSIVSIRRNARAGFFRMWSSDPFSKRLFRGAPALNSQATRRLLAQKIRQESPREEQDIEEEDTLPHFPAFGYGAPIRYDTRVSSAPLRASAGWQYMAPYATKRLSHQATSRDATQWRLHSESVREMIELEMKLNALENGLIFAGRYRIEPVRSAEWPHCRYATERSTGRRVFLKFFPQGRPHFENAAQMHRALTTGHKHICQMLDSMENIHGFPPCLVLERGCHSLADRMASRPMPLIEQKAILYSVLEALEYLHRQGVVHGTLHPGHIMWFARDRAWKLIDLSHASHMSDVTFPSNTGRLACPELARAPKSERLSLTPSMDMWSFGLVAFEVLTFASIKDIPGIVDFIERRLGQPPVSIESTASRWLSANRRGRIERAVEKQHFQFLHAFLRQNPTERLTATEALEDVIFRSATDAYQRMDLLDEFVAEHLTPGVNAALQRWSLLALIQQQLTRDLEIELFVRSDERDVPFYEREVKEPLVFFDDYLEHDPVYVLKPGESFRLRLDLSYDPGMRLPIERIAAVVVKAPDDEKRELTLVQRREEGSISALSFFDSQQTQSQRMNSISPHFGITDKKYVKVLVYTKLQLSDGFLREMEFCDMLYCKVVYPKRHMSMHKMTGMFMTRDERRRRGKKRNATA